MDSSLLKCLGEDVCGSANDSHSKSDFREGVWRAKTKKRAKFALVLRVVSWSGLHIISFNMEDR